MRAPVPVEAVEVVEARAEIEEVVERRLDRFGHEVAREVVDRVERFVADGACRSTRRRRDPTLAVDDPREWELLGQMVELMPLVVRAVFRGIRDLGEREEPERRLHASGSRTAIVTRDVAQSLPSSLRISTSHN